jgi:protein-disulfide isomerase
VVEFMDYGCGYCAKFSAEAFPQLNQEFVSAGRVRWKFVPFVVGMFPNSENAAVAAECAADQGKFLLMSDSLYATRKEWMTTHDPRRVMARLARATRLNEGAFAKCAAGSTAVTRVRRAGVAARAANIRGTPTFFINGQRIDGAIPLPLFRQVLGRILDRPAR